MAKTKDDQAARKRKEQEALELYGAGPFLLIPEDYLIKQEELRKEDPAKGRRRERAAAEYFARRSLPWRDTSWGRKVRLKFLFENPHFLEDVGLVRGALGLLNTQHRTTVGSWLMWHRSSASPRQDS